MLTVGLDNHLTEIKGTAVCREYRRVLTIEVCLVAVGFSRLCYKNIAVGRFLAVCGYRVSAVLAVRDRFFDGDVALGKPFCLSRC